MRIIAIALVLLAPAAAVAGANPDAAVFVDFSGTAVDHDGVEPVTYPVPYNAMSAYIGISRTSEFQAACIRVSLSSESFIVLSWDSLVSDVIIEIWDPEDGVLVAADECLNDDFIYLIRGDMIWTGLPGDIVIEDHPGCPRLVYDCDGGTDEYCVWINGGVGKPPLDGDSGCDPDVPSEPTTWGLMKALYR